MPTRQRTWPAAVSLALLIAGFVVASRLASQGGADGRFNTNADFVAAARAHLDAHEYGQAEALCDEVADARYGAQPSPWEVDLCRAQAAAAQGRLSEAALVLNDIVCLWRDKYWWPSDDARASLAQTAEGLAGRFLDAREPDHALTALSLACIGSAHPLPALARLGQTYRSHEAMAALWPRDVYVLIEDFEAGLGAPCCTWADDTDAAAGATVTYATDDVFRGSRSLRLVLPPHASGARWFAVRAHLPLDDGTPFGVRAHVKAAGLRGDELQMSLGFTRGNEAFPVRSSEIGELPGGWCRLSVTPEDFAQAFANARSKYPDAGPGCINALAVMADALAGEVLVDSIELYLATPEPAAP
ncbi:MAG: hypothetical protein JXR94_04715 [Candidatus Hydrogenedentes bacterium]|nr:hypothetical protein [Candidatus Hydrogenedentota bacterium]